jgi:uncharacterized protein YjeT (DUF2065 family)
LTEQIILALLYVLFGLTLASAPILYIILRHTAETRSLPGAKLRRVVLIAACLIFAVSTEILDGAVYLSGSVILSFAIAALTPRDRLRAFTLALVAIGASGTLL